MSLLTLYPQSAAARAIEVLAHKIAGHEQKPASAKSA
jgi:hypothetical protein